MYKKMNNLNKFIFSAFFLVAAWCFPLTAQQTPSLVIEGTVIEAGTNETLPGVTVIVRGRFGGTSTDVNGNFSIRANRGEWIEFTFVGFETFEYLVTDAVSNLRVTMQESAQQMEDIVVTGVGRQRRISTLAAVASVDAAELRAPATSVANLIGGRVSGVFTQQASGEPGKNLAEFWVRGVSTFGANSAALVLIDGIEGDINAIDPADIESFSVLKDASATAIYGVRGANGVVLITTKRGQSGRLSITGRINYSISQVRRLPDYLRAYDYAIMANEAREMRGEAPLYRNVELEVIKYGLDPDFFPDISWQDEMIRPISFRQSYYVSGRGGADVARYFISLGGTSEQAAYKYEKDNPFASNAGFNTYSFRLNLDINLSPTTELKFNSDGYMSINDRPGDVSSTDYIWQSQAMLTPLLFPLRLSNGQFPTTIIPGFPGAGISPYVVINHTGNTKLTEYRSKFTVALEQDFSFITEGLRASILGSYDRNGGYTELRYRQPAMYQLQGRTNRGELVTREVIPASTQDFYITYLNHDRQYRRFLIETRLNYDRIVAENHRVGGLVMFFAEDDFATNQFLDGEMGGLPMSLAQIPRRYMRVTGRVGYGYRDTYMIDLNFGYTGTENFQPGRQFGFFPSIALGWVPSSYDWTKDNLPWVSLFKIRGSYGTVGNDRIGHARFPYLDRVQSSRGTVFGGMQTLDKISIIRVGADNLVWERAIKSNIGIDASFFDESVSFTVDFFHDKRDGIFQPRVQVPDFAGLTTDPFGNVGSMESWGTDGNVAYTFLINRNSTFTIRGNYTYAQNKVINYERIHQPYPYREWAGMPEAMIFGFQHLGFFENEADIANSPSQSFFGGSVLPGDLKYKDVNGDGVINEDDMVPIDYRNMRPRVTYGFGGTYMYKNLSIGVLFQGVGNQSYMRNSFGYIPFHGEGTGNVLREFNDPSTRWIPRWYAEEKGMPLELAENPNAQLPRLQYGHNSNNAQNSTFWLGNARFLRLKEVTLNYNMRNDFIRRIGITSIDFQLVGNNLYVWDKVKVFDPEQAHRNGMVYPIPAMYSFQMYINL